MLVEQVSEDDRLRVLREGPPYMMLYTPVAFGAGKTAVQIAAQALELYASRAARRFNRYRSAVSPSRN